ncbi:MAG: hypothetical protein JO321_15165 [Solirubrobacterales bacterium]|nr:hypothetical protein [Solirubrobacterales bacterium]MBV8941196.1 hypothetical protein [Solirubrobacterales bacterium]MBV9167080.1 hypothetical protein [Solirubrobacterales bacterium]MBV9536742.1 hypothetical protein [Solirubrobacterales bacterium]
MKTKASLAIGLVAMAAAGCGGGGTASNQQGVRSTFNKVVHELADRNPAACELFSKRYAVENTGQANYQAALATCRAHTSQHSVSLPPGLRIDHVEVKGNTATLKASAPGQGSGIFHFVKESGQWKIDSVTSR